MPRIGKYDGIILGALAGVLVGYPTLATTMNGWLAKLFPTTWLVFGNYSLAVYGGLIGALIGFIAEKSR